MRSRVMRSPRASSRISAARPGREYGKMVRLAIALVFAGALIAGCASDKGGRNAGEELEVRTGVVEEFRRVPLPSASGGYIGMIGGAGAGGIAGGTIGSGRGSQAASVAGAVAGSVAGRA